MLVLSRKTQESIVIDRNIRVRVLGMSRGVVRLGIEAPLEVPVHREEVHERLKAEPPADRHCAA
jgi:carbon storage regulator